MSIRIDNYYISMNKYGHIGICIDGRMIVHTQIKFTTKREVVIQEAINLINDYNKRHNLEWGNVDR